MRFCPPVSIPQPLVSCPCAFLEGAVVVGRLLRQLLDHVPMFDHLAVGHSINIDHRAAGGAGHSNEMRMADDVVAVGEIAMVLVGMPGKLGLKQFDKMLQAARAVGRSRTVMKIAG